jgi:hypothetical protein
MSVDEYIEYCDLCSEHYHNRVYDYWSDDLIFCSDNCREEYYELYKKEEREKRKKEQDKEYEARIKRQREAKESESSGCVTIIIFLIIVPIFLQIIGKGCRAIFFD